MLLLVAALLPGDAILSEPSSTRLLLILATASLLALAGCDTEKGTASQGSAQAPTSAGDSQTRYRVDRSQAGTPLSAEPVRAPDGSIGPLTSLIGRPIVLNLWATWCAPCVEELPTLERLAAAQGNRAQIILLSQDLGEADAPTRFLAERAIRAPQNWHDPENSVGLAAGGNLPTTILYDDTGREVLRVIGPLDWAGPVAAPLLAEAGIGPDR
jgi:thiol-disulfide isomerase/thioredoxin